MKHLITILFLFFCSLSVEAQYTLSTPKEIDVIAVDEQVVFTFYHIKENGVPLYTKLKKCAFHFYEIGKNGKQGYLDIRTFKEYFFNYKK